MSNFYSFANTEDISRILSFPTSIDTASQQQQPAATSSSNAMSLGDPVPHHQQQQQQQQQQQAGQGSQQGSTSQQLHTPLSLSMQPATTSAVTSMPPLNIDMNGLTEQQAAEVVELLTPFLSPAGTPSFNAAVSAAAAAQGFMSHPATPLFLGQQAAADGGALERSQNAEGGGFSPLTSPALVPQQAGGRVVGTQHQLSLSGNTANARVSMPPPSPSITAEHILRRQQQIMMEQNALLQQSPSFPSNTGASARITGPGGRSRRGTASGTSTAQSPLHHPYNTSNRAASFKKSAMTPTQMAFVGTPSFDSTRMQTTDKDEFLLEPLPDSALMSAAVAAASSLHNTPVMQFSASGGDLGSGLSLPGAMAGESQAAAAGRTLHQLNVPPPSQPPPQQRQNSAVMAASALSSMLGGNSAVSGVASAANVSQLNSWMGFAPVPSPVASSSVSASAAPATATPASLMNLPVSAHHLPHTTTGDIVASSGAPPAATVVAATSVLAAAMNAAVMPPSNIIPQATPLMHFVSQSAPGGEFIHPPAPPPLQIGNSIVERTNTSLATSTTEKPVTFIKPASVTEPHTDGRKRGRRKSVTDVASAGSSVAPRSSKGEAKRGRRRSRLTPLASPRATPLVPSILRRPSPAMSPMAAPLTSPGLTPITPAIAPRRPSGSGSNPTTTPRMAPRTPIVAATSTTNIVGLEADVVTRLATKSNYQNIIEGHSELLGLKYHTEFKSGLEKRRTNHKQAEQKRRDSLKLCFDDLKTRLPELNPKLISKIYLLNEANVFIDKLKLAVRRQNKAQELVVKALVEKGMGERELKDLFEDADKMAEEEVAKEIDEEEEEEERKEKERAVKGKARAKAAIERIEEMDEPEPSDAEMAESST